MVHFPDSGLPGTAEPVPAFGGRDRITEKRVEVIKGGVADEILACGTGSLPAPPVLRGWTGVIKSGVAGRRRADAVPDAPGYDRSLK
jgi:hypothetical protein